MRKKVIVGVVLLFLSFLSTYYLAIPMLMSYSKIAGVMQRFPYTDEILWLTVFLASYLCWLQWERKRFSPVFVYLFYSAYFLSLFILLFTKDSFNKEIVLNIFNRDFTNIYILSEMFFNIIYFIPLGILYSLFATKRQVAIIAFITILSIETLQYIFQLGTFDLMDLIMNLLGCWMGYRIWIRLKKSLEEQSAQKRVHRE